MRCGRQTQSGRTGNNRPMTFEQLRTIYEGKKVFVTGHTGFKGTWLVLLLRELGAEVKGYALPPLEHNALYHQVRAELYCESVIGDIRNREKLHREIDKFRPDFIFHMAAQALVIDSYVNPVETFQTNVMGTVHVLDALREINYPCKAIMITTDKVYENKEREAPYQEHEPLGGYDPYSNSKACCELATTSYRLSFFNPEQYNEHHTSIASVRSGNVIGGGDWSENRILPDIARALTADEIILVRNPDSVRPWQHVLDPLHGYLVLGAKMVEDPVKFAQAYNFGPEPSERMTVKELVEEAIDVWGTGAFDVSANPKKVHEAGLLRLDITKAKTELNWQPKYSAREAVQETIAWYKATKEGQDIKSFTEFQIAKFFER